MTINRLLRDLQQGLDPAHILRGYGLTPDAWQEQLLRDRPHRALLLCCRQAGKSLTAAAAALHEAVYRPDSLVLMIAPSQRQSTELLRIARWLLAGLTTDAAVIAESNTSLELPNGSRIVSLPAREDTIRGYSRVALIVIDEAARVDDDVHYAVRPMLAVSGGRLLALSTPNGLGGWFATAWHDEPGWARVTVTAPDCPRISAAFLDEQRLSLPPFVFAAEYLCEFTDAEHSAFAAADIAAAIDPNLEPLEDWK